MFTNLRKKQKSESKYNATTDLSAYSVSDHLDKNEEMIYSIFKDDMTLRVRQFQGRNALLKGFIVFLEGLTDKDMIAESILKPLTDAGEISRAARLIDQIRLTFLILQRKKNTLNIILV